MSGEHRAGVCPCHSAAGGTWPAKSATTEAELFAGYSATPPVTAAQPETARDPRRRRPSALRSPDRAGPVSRLLAIPRGGFRPGAPLGMVVLAPTPDAIAPYLRWLRQVGWHVHVVGRAAYAHRPGSPAIAGWLIGFQVDGEPAPDWLRWLTVHRSRWSDRRTIAGRDAVREAARA